MAVLRRGATLALASPALLVVVALVAAPMAIAVAYSVMTPGAYGGVVPPLTGDAYVRFLFDCDLDDISVFDPTVLVILARSLAQAGAATLLCLGLGLPVAWYVATRSPAVRPALVLLVTLPFWTNLLIRTYCWVLLLRDQGLVNDVLVGSGVLRQPVTFLYSDGAVLLGIVYSSLPFMILPLYSALEKVDPRVVEAAHDLYAGRASVLRRVVWPLAKPGAAAGALLVFIPALGSFLAPDILGGGRHLMIGNLIVQQFTTGRDWPFGSALSAVLMAAVLVALAYGACRRTLRAALG